MYLAGEAGVIDINGTVIVELITFLVMLAILARWVYPVIVRLAEARQQAVAQQLRAEERTKAEEEAKRIAAAARKEIEAERERAVQSVRSEVANLVVAATEKVVGETLDAEKHRRLIDRAIAEVAGGDGSRRQGGS